MLLTTAAFLIIFGLATFTLAHVYSYQGIGAIGAVLVVGAGAGAMIDGLEATTQLGIVETASSFPAGLVLTLLGGAMMMRAVEGGKIT